MPSLTPDITEPIPALLSARMVSADGASAGVLYDVVLSGLGFILAIDSQNPYVRESSPTQKQQIDTSAEAGEQSLDGSWIRSQTSWHLGAGADYYEPGSRDEAVPTRYRYKDSRGVDPWDIGRLTLHRQMDSVQSTIGNVAVCGARLSTGEDVWYSRVGNEVFRHHSGGITSHGVYAFMDGGALTPAGSSILIGGGFGVAKTDLTGATVTALLTRAIGAPCTPYWAKGRIITTTGREIHENVLAAGALDATSLHWTHPDTGWLWSGVAEAPDAILASGYSGGVSSIYAFVLAEDGAGTVPKLGQPFQVAELPPGEEIRSIRSYLGRYLGIGTTAGIRVGVLGDRGQVQYGPVIVETAAPVTSLGARDSYLYAAAGNSVIRVNLAESIGDTLRFPYAYDVETPAGKTITSLAFDGVTSRVVVGSDANGTYAASETAYVASGWLTSGDIRYGTTAPKAFRTLDVNATTDATTSVGVSATVAGTEQTLVTLSLGKSGQEVGLGSLPVPLQQIGYRLLLAGTVGTPTVEAVAVKAVPVPKKRRLIQYPVQVADRGRDPRGTAYGRKGFGSDLLAALESLEDSQTIVTVNDLSRPEQYEAVVEKVEFTRVEPTARTGGQNFGGVAKITVSTL